MSRVSFSQVPAGTRAPGNLNLNLKWRLGLSLSAQRFSPLDKSKRKQEKPDQPVAYFILKIERNIAPFDASFSVHEACNGERGPMGGKDGSVGAAWICCWASMVSFSWETKPSKIGS